MFVFLFIFFSALSAVQSPCAPQSIIGAETVPCWLIDLCCCLVHCSLTCRTSRFADSRASKTSRVWLNRTLHSPTSPLCQQLIHSLTHSHSRTPSSFPFHSSTHPRAFIQWPPRTTTTQPLPQPQPPPRPLRQPRPPPLPSPAALPVMSLCSNSCRRHRPAAVARLQRQPSSSQKAKSCSV